MACVRMPGGDGKRGHQVKEFRTFTRELRALRDWLVEAGVTSVAMEATGSYWKPVWYVLD
ncbi:MAG: IS110 family transposase, partial [bacterium]